MPSEVQGFLFLIRILGLSILKRFFKTYLIKNRPSAYSSLRFGEEKFLPSKKVSSEVLSVFFKNSSIFMK